MDPLTHACMGYCLARASTAAREPRAAAVAGLIATLPDLDLVVQAALDPVAAFAFHRGPLHSLPCALLGGLLLAPVVARLATCSLRRAATLAALALVCHGLLDLLTGYGTALLWPFTERRFSLELLFVIDPVATLPLVVACGLDLLGPRGWRDVSPRLAAAAVAAFGLYATLALTLRSAAVAGFERSLAAAGTPPTAIHAEPTAGGAMLWYLCADTGDEYHMLYRSAWDGDRWERARHLPIDRAPLQELADDPLAAAMRNLFGRWYTCLPLDEQRFAVVDVRLGHRHGWSSPDAPFLFRYLIEPGADGAVAYRHAATDHGYDPQRLGDLALRSLGRIPPELRAPEPQEVHREP